MRRRKALTSLISMVLVAVLALAWTFKVENVPLLGLDLRGGVSVVLEPQPATPGQAIPEENIETAISIMNQRINSIGVAEPDIHREGQNIVVQIAGVKDPDAAIKIVGETAQLRFRPVLQANLPPDTTTPTSSTVVPETQGTTPGSTPATAPGTTIAGAAVPTEGSSTTTAPPPPAPHPPANIAQQAPTTPAPTTPTDPTATTVAPVVTDPSASTIPIVPTDPTATTIPVLPTDPNAAMATTPREKDDPKATVILPADPKVDPSGTRYQLGPVLLTGEALEGASAGLGQNGEWQVNPKFKAGADGIDLFNKAASLCFSKAPECPTGQLAMTLDSLVISAPNIKVASFSADQIEISGSFNEETARNLSTALNYGALPFVLKPLQTEIVSSTLGSDALRAGLFAGFVGLALVAVYMTAFYRLLGVLAILKLFVEAALIWSFISYLGATAGLALTLAGITGIIVSIGVSLDSNVVYYEHLREDIRNGRTVRSAIDRSFGSAFGTILKADGASLLGAALLYWLAVGPVRGFAFYLGLSTLLDLVSSWYYMRPVVFLAASSKLAQRHPGWFGLPPAPDAIEPEPTVRERPSRAAKTKSSKADSAKTPASTTGAN